MHDSLLGALRAREQEVFLYLGLLGPALGFFVWLLGSDPERWFFIFGTIGVQLLLFLGAYYSLALGYNYRYINLQLAKIEVRLGVRYDMLREWPKSPEEFRRRYRRKIICRFKPWCTPPEVIKVFWHAFVAATALVPLAAVYRAYNWNMPCALGLIALGGIGLLLAGGLVLPIIFGRKLERHCLAEGPW